MCQSKANGGRRCKPSKGRSSATMTRAGGTASPELSAQVRRTRRTVLRDAKEQLGNLLDSVVDAEPVSSAADLASAVDQDAAGQIADAVTASLKDNGWRPGRWRSHQMCAALAATAHAMEAGEDQAKDLITQGVTTALASAGVPAMPLSLS
jgi:hypothetical protein